jgi:hypothetical protein
MSGESVFAAFATSVLVGVCAFIVGISLGADHIKTKAIEQNCAEWTIDAKTGERAFVWKPSK